MIDTKYESADHYCKKLRDGRRKGVASDSALLKIDEIANQNLGFISTLAFVDRVLNEEKARLNPRIAANLCSQVGSPEDWIIQEQIFGQANGGKAPAILLLKAMISTAAKIQEVKFLNIWYRSVIKTEQRPTELMVEFAKGFLVLKNFDYGCHALMELIEKKGATEELIVFAIQALRAHDDYLAARVYKAVVDNGFVSAQTDSAMFDPIIVVKRMEPVGLSIEATIEQPVRGLEETPIEQSKSKPIEERLLIKHRSIEFYMDKGVFGFTVDLHGRSYDQAKLMVEGCFSAFDADPQLGNTFSVITGIGRANKPNFFRMQNCIMDWVKENRNDADASQLSFNRGQLYIRMKRVS